MGKRDEINLSANVERPQDRSNALGEKSNAPSENQNDQRLSPTTAYFRLWSYSTSLDTIGRIVATAATLGAGTVLPLMAIIFGSFVNLFNQWALGLLSPDDFRSNIDQNALYLVYLWIGRFVVSLMFFGVFQFSYDAFRIPI
jgi:ATP-binding cassette, subfamily B (MDR/TAP), member 1